MAWVRWLVVLTGVALGLGGVAALIDPLLVASQLGLAASSNLGAATLRGDLFSFFGTAGGIAIYAAARRQRALLVIPMMMMGAALCGRVVSLGFVAFDSTMVPPMVAEAIMVAIFAAGRVASSI
jgi:hypothetical protein